MKAIIEIDVPEWQIGQEVKIYFPDTMMIQGKTIPKENCADKHKYIFKSELKDIKAEIDVLYGVYYFKERLVNIADVMQILDKHIKENKE